MARVNEAHHPLSNLLLNHQVKERGVTVFPDARSALDVDELMPRLVLRGEGAVVQHTRDVLNIGPIGSRSDYLTVTFGDGVWLTTGCFSGTLAQFEEELRGMNTIYADEYRLVVAVLYAFAEMRL